MVPRSVLLIFIALSAALSLCGAESFETSVRPLLAKHCFDCHGPDLQKARMRLDTLTPDFASAHTAETWTKALDKISSGQMPPPSEERPPKEALSAAASFLTAQLHRSSLERQHREGRVPLRRLNRVEYENTLSDLLSIRVEVKDLLPDDKIVAGFDNVSEGLDISSAHFLRYQEAAEKALAAAVPFRPRPLKETRSGLKMSEANGSLKKTLEQITRLRGETLVVHSRLPRFSAVATPGAPVNGRYRVRMSAYAVGTGGKSMPVAFHHFAEGTRDEGEVRGCLDVPSDKAAVIELEVDLRYREKLIVNGWTLPWEQDFRRDVLRSNKITELPKDFAGPGLAVEWLELDGPLDAPAAGTVAGTLSPGSPGPASYRRLFGDLPLKARSVVRAEAQKSRVPTIPDNRGEYQWLNDPLIPVSAQPHKDAERLLRDFIPRAARRPVAPDVLDYYVRFAHARLDKGSTFGEAMLAAYKAVLCSTHFLFLEERPGKLDGYALASRLSYFFWRSMPDEKLLALAAEGTLSKPDVLAAQTERLLKDPKAARFIEDFTGQWLELRKINATSPDPQLYGEFDQYLLWSMPRETRLYFEENLSRDLSVANFIHSDWTFLNERLAKHYGIPGVSGSALKKTALPPGLHRGGVLTHGSVLKVTADGTRTSPILRGKWVLEHMLGKPPAAPPPDIPAIEPDIRGATTIRQQLDKHRNTPACASCHVHIDPPGFALETFDVIGGWREFYRASKSTGKKVEVENYPGLKAWRGLDVEKGGQTPGGRAFKDIDEYKQILLEDKEQVARNIIQKLLIFSTGADIQFADREVVEQIVAAVRKKDYGLRTMIQQVVQSRVFVNK